MKSDIDCQETTLFQYQEISNGFLASITESQLSGQIKAEILRIEIGGLIQKLNPKVVVLDMSEVKMISSVVIGTLVQIHKRLTSRNSELRQCCLPPLILDVYRTAGLNGTVFNTYETYEDAVAAPPALTIKNGPAFR